MSNYATARSAVLVPSRGLGLLRVDRVEFETLISDTSAMLMSAPLADVDAAIERVLGRVMAFFQADRCGLLTVSTGSNTVTVTHAAYMPGVIQVSGDIDLMELYPWSGAELLIKRVPVLVSQMSELPPAAAMDRASWEAIGTRSNLTVPIVSGTTVSHLIVIHSVNDERQWAPYYVSRLRVLGEMMSSAMQRRRDLEALRATEERLTRAAAAGRCNLWEYDPGSGDLWVTPETRRIYGFAPDERVTFDLFVSMLHPDDRLAVMDRIGESLGAGVALDVRYRTTARDGTVRWMHATGAPDSEGCLLGVSVNVTAEVQAEEHDRQQAARIAAAVDAAGVGLADLIVGSRPPYLDERLCELLGLEPGDEHRMPDIWFSRIDPKHLGLVRDQHRQLLAGDLERANLEYRYQHPSRGWIWLRHSTLRLSDATTTAASTRLIGAIQDITDRRLREEALKCAHDAQKQRTDRLERENLSLRKQAADSGTGSLVAGHTPILRKALTLADQVAVTNSTVLLLGETGTGKERFAAHIHEVSSRRGRHMVRVNCSAIPAALIESELFGREKGAYTGALSRQIGRFELAQGSTLFLDEIGELPLDVQVKLLRVLQERTIERLGSPTPIPVDVRIIVATNRDLEAAVREGSFRSDLYYRLNVFPLVVPPLRHRTEDIPALVQELVRELGVVMRKRFDSVDQSSLDALAHYDWPGNVRELRNVLERAMILCSGPTLTVEVPDGARHRPAVAPSPSDHPGGLLAWERDQIQRVLHDTGWRIRGSRGAAAVLDLKPTTLEKRMARLGIQRPSSRG
jgi:formate hydrogenlyase transcriptional activator